MINLLRQLFFCFRFYFHQQAIFIKNLLKTVFFGDAALTFFYSLANTLMLPR